MVAANAQMLSPNRESALLDDMVCRGDYADAVKLAKRDLFSRDLDRTLLLPYVGALFIEIGHLQDADGILNPSRFNMPDSIRAAMTREQAALLLARGQYQQSSAKAAEALRFSFKDGIYDSRRAYAGSIAAEALLRSGDARAARELAMESLKAVEKRTKPADFFIPRVFFAACLVSSYGPNPQEAEPLCQKGLGLLRRRSKPNRDLSLGHLALAEARLQNGDINGSQKAANDSLKITIALFGTLHQDSIRALQLLSAAELKDGKTVAARNDANNAIALAKKLIGPESSRVSELTAKLVTTTGN